MLSTMLGALWDYGLEYQYFQYFNYLLNLAFLSRVENCASWFLNQPHCEAKGKIDLQSVFPRGVLKRACGSCDYSHV